MRKWEGKEQSLPSAFPVAIHEMATAKDGLDLKGEGNALFFVEDGTR